MPSVLILEDDPLQAAFLEGFIQNLGFHPYGPFYRVEEAKEAIATRLPDAALLDYAIGDQTSRPIQEALSAAGVPFAVLTGETRPTPVMTSGTSTMVIPKPSDDVGLEIAVYELIRRSRTANARGIDRPRSPSPSSATRSEGQSGSAHASPRRATHPGNA